MVVAGGGGGSVRPRAELGGIGTRSMQAVSPSLSFTS